MDDVYYSYDYVPQEDFAEVLLRTGKLAETKTEGQQLFPATEGNPRPCCVFIALITIHINVTVPLYVTRIVEYSIFRFIFFCTLNVLKE